MGSADPLEKWLKIKKSENMQKEQFSMFMLYFESTAPLLKKNATRSGV